MREKICSLRRSKNPEFQNDWWRSFVSRHFVTSCCWCRLSPLKILAISYWIYTRGPVAQLLARRTIDQEVANSNQAGDSDKCHRVAKDRGPLLANSTSSTEMRHPPALSLPTLTLVGMGEISIFFFLKYKRHASVFISRQNLATEAFDSIVSRLAITGN